MDLTRFRKICGMLGSSHEGERANAAQLATQMLREAGLTWDSVTIGSDTLPQPQYPRPRPRPAPWTPPPPPPQPAAKWWVEMASEIRMEDVLGSLRLSQRQREFIDSIMLQSYEPTERQAGWLGTLHAMAMASRGD